MYIGFELKNLKEEFFNGSFKEYLQIGEKELKKYKLKISETIKDFTNADESINGNKMQSAWFPKIDADVFLSHSHADKELIIAFAGWLKEVFDLKVFVDSCIWGYSKVLQKIIDNEYSRDEYGILKYDKVLYASSHVHMMLNTALMQMIDNCECIIFINTPNSVKPREVINKVVSPWIYSEIGITKLIKKKNIDEHRIKELNERTKTFSKFEIEYNLETDHLNQLAITDLSKWKHDYRKKTKNISLSNYIETQLNNSNSIYIDNALDYLYRLKFSGVN